MNSGLQSPQWPDLPNIRELTAESWRLQREATLLRLLSRTLARIERDRVRILAESEAIRRGPSEAART